MHQVPVHCTYITTEAMTTKLFYAMYCQAVGYPELIRTVASRIALH